MILIIRHQIYDFLKDSNEKAAKFFLDQANEGQVIDFLLGEEVKLKREDISDHELIEKRVKLMDCFL